MTIKYILARLLRAALTLVLVVTFVFFALRLAGDPVAILLPDNLPNAAREEFRVRWGLDAPLYIQYFRYVAAVIGGDFGISFRDGRPALNVVLERVPATLILSLSGLVVAVAIGIPAGIIAALKRNSVVDRVVIGFAVIGHSLPTFFFGIILILLFSIFLRWLPSSGSASIAHLVMPAATIGLWNAASLARFTRASMLDVLGQPFMKTALASGLPIFWRVFRYALPNAAIPIVTMFGLIIGQLLSGAVIVETVFAWPGIGRLTVTAVAAREVAIVQTIVIFSALTMVCANLVVDLLYGWLDPRIGSKVEESRQ